MRIPDNYRPDILFQGCRINREDNTINGNKLSDPLEGSFLELIHVLNERHSRIMAGKMWFEQIDWEYKQWNYLRNKHYYVDNYREADDLVGYISCLICGRLHKLVFPYDWQDHYQCMLQTGDIEISCWNCSQRYYIDHESYVWVGGREVCDG